MRYIPVDRAQFAQERLRHSPSLDLWEYTEGALRATFTMQSFSVAGALAAAIARAADDADHHPDIDLRYPGLVRVLLTTHDTGGVTDYDVRLAAAIARLATTFGPAPGA